MGKFSNDSAKWLGKKMAECVKNIDKPKEKKEHRIKEEFTSKDLCRHLFGDIVMDMFDKSIKK